MKKGSLTIRIIIVVVAAVLGLLGTFWINGYFSTWNSVLKVDKADIAVNIAKNGIAHIHENEFYTFVKPYHGLAPYMDLPHEVRLENFKVSVNGAKIKNKMGAIGPNGFNLRIYLNSGYNIPKPGGDRVSMNLDYDIVGGVQTGSDFSQFFHKFWGKGTPSWIPELKVVYNFDPIYKVKDVFVHPMDVPHSITREGNTFTIVYHNLPPNAYAEARFALSKIHVAYFSTVNKTYSEITGIENSYFEKAKWIWILALALLALAGVIPFVSFYFFGVEPKVELHSEYEREIPYNDPPAIVNSIVKRLVSNPDSDGFSSTVLGLVDKGYLSFAGKGAFKLQSGNKPLDETESLLLKLVIKPYATEGIFDPESLKDLMKGNVSYSKKFLSDYQTWQIEVGSKAETRNYIVTYGNTLAKTLAVAVLILLPLALIAWLVMEGREYPQILQMVSWFAFIDWTVAWIMLVLPKDVFGRWTKVGREYYLRWKNFEKYLSDYSLIKEKAPESVVLWDQYLIYGTAIGIAKKVSKAIKEINPKGMEDSPLYPALTDLYWYTSISRLPYYAIAHSSESSSGGGSFGGDVGGGFGGGGRGGF